MCTICCLLVCSLCCYFHFCCVAIIFLLSCVRLIFFKLFFLSAAITRWPYDCMRPAGEDGGLERVFIERPANTDCVAEPRSTATYIVSYRMARITFTTCLILPEITRISIHIVWFRGRRVGWVGGVRRRGVTVWKLRGCWGYHAWLVGGGVSSR